MKVAITGSGGWLARCAYSALHVLKSEGLDIEVFMFSSKPQKVELRSNVAYQTKLLQDIEKYSFDLFVPLSFLTQEKFNELGEANYRLRNIELIQNELKVLKSWPNSKVLLVSSGVVNNLSDLQASKPSYSCYADLKRFQEKLYREAVSDSNFSICYLYSCTSIDIPNWQNYAFSSIVHNAFYGQHIFIQNSLPVQRRFVDATDLFYVMFKEIYKGKNFSISSGGPLIEIEELARKAAGIFKSNSIISREKNTIYSRRDAYFATDNTMEQMFERQNKEISTIEKQILSVGKIFLT